MNTSNKFRRIKTTLGRGTIPYLIEIERYANTVFCVTIHKLRDGYYHMVNGCIIFSGDVPIISDNVAKSNRAAFEHTIKVVAPVVAEMIDGMTA
jgi:hypothetical protein